MQINDLSRVPKSWPNRQFSETLKIEGIDWHYQISRHANPLAKTIVLIHGTGSSAHSWTNIFPLLAKDFTVIAPDLPGHGFTIGAKKADLHINKIAIRLHQFFETLSVHHLDVLIGHSAGADCAIALSLLYEKSPNSIIGFNPALVNPLSMYNTFLGPLMNPFATSGFMASFIAASLPLTGMVDQLLDSTNSILTEKQREPYRILFKEQSHIYGALNFMTASNVDELLQRSSSITSAFTFLVAAQDPWVPENTLLPVIHRYFPNAKIYIEEGGHLFHEINPKRAMKIIHEALMALHPNLSSEYA
jgi:magnesium chelatase accessory protein